MSTTDDGNGVSLETARAVPADGDDIVVLPDGPDEASGRRRRALLIGLAVVVVLVAIALAIVAHNNGSKTAVVRTTPPTAVTTPAVVKPAATAPVTAATPTVPAVAPLPTATVPRPVPVTPVFHTRQTAVTQGSVAPPATVPAPTSPPPPKQYGATALTWSAPHSLTIVSGHAVSLFVTAHNPTDGIVTLPHPLSCAPHLDHSESCTQNVQLVSAGQSASAGYTIDARGVAPGRYTLSIEGVFAVSVTVTPAPA